MSIAFASWFMGGVVGVLWRDQPLWVVAVLAGALGFATSSVLEWVVRP